MSLVDFVSLIFFCVLSGAITLAIIAHSLLALRRQVVDIIAILESVDDSLAWIKKAVEK